MACSLASRTALMEAGIDARYHLVNIFNKEILQNKGDFWSISAKGAVLVLVLEDGEKLTSMRPKTSPAAGARP
jgi:glutathione S-transferase